MVQIVLTVIFYIWLFAALAALLYLAIQSDRRQRQLQDALIDVSQRSAEAAQKAADAAQMLALYLRRES